MAAKRKPKFRVGQVVACGSSYWRITDIREYAGTVEYAEIWSWHQEKHLRPLTAREIGPRKGKRCR